MEAPVIVIDNSGTKVLSVVGQATNNGGGNHQGTIMAESVEGEGTRFEVYLKC